MNSMLLDIKHKITEYQTNNRHEPRFLILDIDQLTKLKAEIATMTGADLSQIHMLFGVPVITDDDCLVLKD